MNAIDQLFRRLRPKGRKAFIPFVTAGDPDVETTERLVLELVSRGASLVEIGFPYSDPIADGAVIQASYTRALERGLRLDDIFALARRLSAAPALVECGVPLVAMASYSLVHRRGPDEFVAQSQAAGFSGAILPDLPVEEAETVGRSAAARDFKLIHLVTPTTPRERAVRIAQSSTGFLYCVSLTGITGARERLPDELLGQLGWLRQQTDLPLCVGFGISKPDHVQMLRDVADGVIVGSALVRPLETAARRPREEIVREIGDLAGSLAKALNPDERHDSVRRMKERRERRHIEREFGVPIAGEILPPEQWTKTDLKRLPAEGPLRWPEIFGRTAPVVLDLGCGNGRFLLGIAVWRPDHDHLGLDILPVVIRYATRRANQRGLKNVRFAVIGGHEFLQRYVEPASVAEIHCYHPQPYDDQTQAHRRLVTPEFLALVHHSLIPNGQFFLQTDHRGYWQYMKTVVSEFFDFEQRAGPWPDAPKGRTRREIIAMRRGLAIFRGSGAARAGLSSTDALRLAETLPPPVFDADCRSRELDELERRVD